MKKALLGALMISAMTAVQASAITIDFNSSAWQSGAGDGSHTVGNVEVDAQGDDAELTWNSTYGLGVDSDGDNGEQQVQEGERLRVNFLAPFTLTSFTFNRFFDSEEAFYRLNSTGQWISLSGSSAGTRTISLPTPTLITSIQFGYSGGRDGGTFWLRQINGDFGSTQPAAVPEPTSMILLGTGLLGLVARARRKAQA